MIEASRASNKANSFRLVKPDGRIFYLYSATEQEANQWKEVLQKEITSGNNTLDHTSITALIFYLFSDFSNASIVRDAAWRLKEYLEDIHSDSGLITFLQQPSSFKPLRKLVSAPAGLATPIQVALLRKLHVLALIEEVGKSLIASGFIDLLYGHLELEKEKEKENENETQVSEIQIEICSLIASMSHFDFFPCGKSLRSIFPWMKVNTPSKMLYHIATIFRNASPFIEFRKLVIEEKAMDDLYACFECEDQLTLEKFLQSLLLLICDQSQCSFSSSLFYYACHLSLNPLTHLIDKISSPKVQWILIKIMNSLSAVGTF